MTYPHAKEILRNASGIRNEGDITARLIASPGRLIPFDSSTAGELPHGNSFGDEVLRALLIVRRHLVGHTMVERDLMHILLELSTPVRQLAADERYQQTRIPQIALLLSIIPLNPGQTAPFDA